MVYYRLMISAEMENVASLQPMAGCDNPNFTFYFKLKCENCGEKTDKETCVSLNEQVAVPKSRGVANLVQKCKFCDREVNITMVAQTGRPLTAKDSEDGTYAPLMSFDCRGLEPVDFVFMGPQWRVQTKSGIVFEEVDLSDGEWAEYDEKRNVPVSISNLKSKFDPMKEPWKTSVAVNHIRRGL